MQVTIGKPEDFSIQDLHTFKGEKPCFSDRDLRDKENIDGWESQIGETAWRKFKIGNLILTWVLLSKVIPGYQSSCGRPTYTY